MRIAVISCWAYRDAWKPFFALLDKFWPNHTIPTLITDVYYGDILHAAIHTFAGGFMKTWCELIAEYTTSTDEPILLFQEDFFLTIPVEEKLIFHGLHEFMKYRAGCVRLYPCPGGDTEYGDKYYAKVEQDAPYRASCQAAIWNPDYLRKIAENAKGSAMHFEVLGNRYAPTLSDVVLAFKRDVEPWPMKYLCSGISNGRWDPNAKKLCDQYGIENDWTMRPFAA